MGYVLVLVVGAVIGAAGMFFFLLNMRRTLANQKSQQAVQAAKLKSAGQRVREAQTQLAVGEEVFSKKTIRYDELQQENQILKTDLQNIDVELRKLQLDRQNQERRQEGIDERANDLGGRYLKENVKWIGSKLTSNNYANSKKRLLQVIELCRGIGLDIPKDREDELLADLKAEYERVLRAEFERQEQARIKAQIREEQKLEREIERELKQLERERAAIQAALEKALADAEGEHSEEIERLKAKLKEAEERSERTKSRAEMTRSGHVYVISNIGSFGEGVFKIGMTRRLEPDVRVRELSNASVPFRFDVHMMISSDDAPTLENELHRALHRERLNKVNPRKEFFRSDIETLRQLVEKSHGEVNYIADAEALEYNQTVEMSEEDFEFIEASYEALEDEENQEPVPDDV